MIRSALGTSAALLFSMALVCSAGGAAGREIYVAPQGAPEGDGSPQRPLDLATALRSPQHVKPRDTVWLRRGTYRGPFEKPAAPSGTKEQPIVYRAMPGQRVTLTAAETDRHVLQVSGAEHVWFWGFEVRDEG